MPGDSNKYHRQQLLEGWGREGQRRLIASHAVIVGCGAIGCPAADLLARAGVGRLTLIDRDTVEPTNLHRQTLFTQADAEAHLPKAAAAAARLAEVNPDIELRPIVADLDAAAAERLLTPAGDPPDVILDGTDNFETRYLINDLAVRDGLAYLYAGAIATGAMAMPILPTEPGMPCLRCLFRDPPPPDDRPTCDTAGVFAPVSAMIGAYQAGEAIKLMLGRGELVARSLIRFDLWDITRSRVKLDGSRDPDCPCCGKHTFPYLDGTTGQASADLCGADAVQIAARAGAGSIDLAALADRLRPVARVTSNPFLLRADLSEPACTITVFRDGRAIVAGTSDPARARSIYARFVGM